MLFLPCLRMCTSLSVSSMSHPKTKPALFLGSPFYDPWLQLFPYPAATFLSGIGVKRVKYRGTYLWNYVSDKCNNKCGILSYKQ